MKNRVVLGLFVILFGFAAIAVAAKVYTYKCMNAGCGYIMQFETMQAGLKCPKCKWAMTLKN